MGAVIFTARRALLVADGTLVSLDVGVRAYNRRKVRTGESALAIDGTRENILHRIERRANVETTLHTDAERPAVDQWVESVMNGEAFELDPWGTVASPVDARTVAMVATTITEARLGRTGYRLSFEVIEL